jgi:hypothetical protein
MFEIKEDDLSGDQTPSWQTLSMRCSVRESRHIMMALHKPPFLRIVVSLIFFAFKKNFAEKEKY